ncbi:MAG TPA: hypothetical protein DHV36_19495 [Desulfobacteraceae bacterium]|nr:hypothetical protein [Desulfobacteraceae bacterium]
MKKRVRFINFISATYALLLVGAVVSVASYTLITQYRNHLAREKEIRQGYVDTHRAFIQREVDAAVSLIESERQGYENRLRQEIILRTREGHRLITSLYERYKTRLPETELKSLLLNTLAGIRFFENHRGYYFVVDTQGVTLLSAGDPSVVEQKMTQIANPRAAEMIRSLLVLGEKQAEGFNDIQWSVPGESILRPKLIYYKMFSPYGWYVGTGEYLDMIVAREQITLLERLSRIRFTEGEDGYIFVMNTDGIMLMHPILRDLEGKNVLDHVTDDGKAVFREMISIAQDRGQGFINYSWFRPSVLESAPKLSFVRLDPQWQWIISTGVYTDAIEAQLRQENVKIRGDLQKKISNILAATCLILIFLFMIHVVVRRYAGSDLKTFIHHFKTAAESGGLIPAGQIRFKEFHTLSNAVNQVLIDKQKAEQELIEQATMDGLTRIPNRRHFLEHLQNEIGRSRRYGQPLSLFVMDLDHFKRVNDTYGHTAGDYVLKTFADIAADSLRQVDLLGRLGGEEFGVVLPQTDLEPAVEAAQRLCSAVASHPFSFEGADISVTVSIGVSTVVEPEHVEIVSLLKCADQHMYKAKEGGRNQVCSGLLP